MMDRSMRSSARGEIMAVSSGRGARTAVAGWIYIVYVIRNPDKRLDSVRMTNPFFKLALAGLVLKASGGVAAQAVATKPAETAAADAVGQVVGEALRDHVFA